MERVDLLRRKFSAGVINIIYLFQKGGGCGYVGIALCSTSFMTRFTVTMEIPWLCQRTVGKIVLGMPSYMYVDKEGRSGLTMLDTCCKPFVFPYRKLHPLKPGTVHAHTRWPVVIFTAFQFSTDIYRSQRLGQKRHDHHTGQARVCGYNKRLVNFCWICQRSTWLSTLSVTILSGR